MPSRPLFTPLLGLVASLLAGCDDVGLDALTLPAADTGALAEESAGGESEADSGGTDGGGGASGGAGSGGSSGDGDGGADDGDGDAGQDGGAGCAPDAGCTHDSFPVLIHQATQDISNPALPMFVYQARDVESLPFDELQILSYQGSPYHGPSTPGAYNLAGSNYANCGLCVLVVTDCNDGYQCDQVFFAEEGVLDVADFGDRSGTFRAVLRDAVLQEVTLDPATYESRPVPGGDRWCIDELDITVSAYLYY